jgi:hypothetical protein
MKMLPNQGQFAGAFTWPRREMSHEEEALSVERMGAALKQAEMGLSGRPPEQRSRQLKQTLHRWKKEYAGLEPQQARVETAR